MPEKNTGIGEKRNLCCPKCGHEIDVAVYENTTMINFPFCCPKCQTETLIDVFQYKVLLSREYWP